MSVEISFSYKVIILDVVFKVCKIKVDSVILLNYVEIIIKMLVCYNYVKLDVKMIIILDQISEFYWDDVWNGKCLFKMYIVFVKQVGVNGSYMSNFFNF